VLWKNRDSASIKCLNTGFVFTLPDIRVKTSSADKQMCPLPGGRVAVYGVETGTYIHKVITVSTYGVESVEDIFSGATHNLNIVYSGGRLYVAFPLRYDDNGEDNVFYDNIYVYGRFFGEWRKIYHRTMERHIRWVVIRTPVSLTATPGGGLALFYMKDEPIGGPIFEKAIMVRSPDGVNWGPEMEVLRIDPFEANFFFCDSSYYTDGGVICTVSFSNFYDKGRIWFWRTAAVAPPLPPTPTQPTVTTVTQHAIEPRVSSFCYYFTSENGCVLLVRATFENGDPLPYGTKVFLDGECLRQVEWDVWYKTYPAGQPAPAVVTPVFEIPGMMRVMLSCPVSVRGLMGGLTVFTVDREGKPVLALVRVEAGGNVWTSRSADGVASFPGLPAGRATVSAIPVEAGRYVAPSPVSVDVAPNRVTTVTMVFSPLYDPSKTGGVSITNTGAYTVVVRTDAGEEARIAPGETVYLDLPAGKHFITYTGENPLLFEPQHLVFEVPEGGTLSLSVSASPARDEKWLEEWMENIRLGRGVGDLAVLVVDKATGLPVQGATVFLDVGLQLTTGADGRCRFTGVPAGDRTVTASSPGFFPSKARVRVEAGMTSSVTVELRGFLYEAKPPPPTGWVVALLFLVVLLSGLLLAWGRREKFI